MPPCAVAVAVVVAAEAAPLLVHHALTHLP